MLIFQDRQDHSYCNSVITAKRSPVGMNAAFLHSDAQALLLHVQIHIRILHADHIQMTLQHKNFALRISG